MALWSEEWQEAQGCFILRNEQNAIVNVEREYGVPHGATRNHAQLFVRDFRHIAPQPCRLTIRQLAKSSSKHLIRSDWLLTVAYTHSEEAHIRLACSRVHSRLTIRKSAYPFGGET